MKLSFHSSEFICFIYQNTSFGFVSSMHFKGVEAEFDTATETDECTHYIAPHNTESQVNSITAQTKMYQHCVHEYPLC